MINTADFILIAHNQTRLLLPTEEILYVQAIRVYSIIYVRGSGQQYIIARNIGDICRQLDATKFLRVHKSYIINMHEIKFCQISRTTNVILNDDTVISVAQRRKSALLDYLMQAGMLRKP